MLSEFGIEDLRVAIRENLQVLYFGNGSPYLVVSCTPDSDPEEWVVIPVFRDHDGPRIRDSELLKGYGNTLLAAHRDLFKKSAIALAEPETDGS